MSVRRTRFYLDKRNKRFMGVCAGIADYFGWDATWVRIAADNPDWKDGRLTDLSARQDASVRPISAARKDPR